MLNWSKSLMRRHHISCRDPGDEFWGKPNLGTPGQETGSVSSGVSSDPTHSDLSISPGPASYPGRDNKPIRRSWPRIRRRGSSRRRLRTQASGKSVWRRRRWKRTRSSTRGGTRAMTLTSSPTDTPLRPRQPHTRPHHSMRDPAIYRVLRQVKGQFAGCSAQDMAQDTSS